MESKYFALIMMAILATMAVESVSNIYTKYQEKVAAINAGLQECVIQGPKKDIIIVWKKECNE